MRAFLLGALGLLVVLIALVAAGAVAGAGPLAGITPARDVKDPKEMVARSLQAVLDAKAVHLEAEVAGTMPAEVLGTPEAVDLAGTVADGDIRPKDAKTRLHVEIPAAGVATDTVSSWDALWYRTAPGGAWTKGSIGEVASAIGFDANPLTLVDRLRGWLAQGVGTPEVEDVACGSASGTCRQITFDAGATPGDLLGQVVMAARDVELPPTRTAVTLLADRETLRPLRLQLDVLSDDGSVDMRIAITASGWDEDRPIEEPAAGS